MSISEVTLSFTSLVRALTTEPLTSRVVKGFSSNLDLPEHPSDVPTCISHSRGGGVQHIYMIS